MIAIFPEIVACAESGQTEKLAVLVRKYFGGDKTYAPRLPVASLYKHAGLELQNLPIASQAALLVKDEKGAVRIVAVMNESVAAETQNFMLAHMLGHILFDIQPRIARGEPHVSGFRESQCPMGRYAGESAGLPSPAEQADLEKRADEFAAALLMPKAMMVRAYDKIKSVEKLAAFFGVSEACMKKRLASLQLVKDTPANFIEAEARIQEAKPKSKLSMDINPASQLNIDDKKLPRSVVTASYGAKAKEEVPVDKPTSDSPKRADKIDPDQAPSKGMARIRELARRLDKSV